VIPSAAYLPVLFDLEWNLCGSRSINPYKIIPSQKLSYYFIPQKSEKRRAEIVYSCGTYNFCGKDFK
jgi:hypothetical protein